MSGLVCLLALLAATAAPGNSQDGRLARLLDPARNFAEARKLIDSGDSQAAREPLMVALEQARVDSPTWAAALLLAMRDFPDMALSILSTGEGEEVPLVLLPDPIEAGDASSFPVPASYLSLDFLPPKKKKLVSHLLKTEQEVEASRILEQSLQEEGRTPPMLLYLAALYERMGEMGLAWKRYEEAAQIITLDKDRFAVLYSRFRLLYARERYFEAQEMLKPFTALAKARITGFVEKIKTSPGGRDGFLTQLLQSRRHLVEALNFQAIINQRRGHERNSQLLFGQARILNPGRLPLALNYNQILGQVGHNQTAATNLSRLRQVLLTVAAEVRRLVDRSIDTGLPSAQSTYTRGLTVLNRWLTIVSGRQGIRLYNLRKLTEAEEALSEAITYDSKEPLPYYYLGLILLEQERLSEASVNFRKALTNAAGRTELARLAREKADAILEAQTDELLASRNPEDKARERIATQVDLERFRPLREGLERVRAEIAEGRMEDATQRVENLLELFPESADAYHEQALLKKRQGDMDGALRSFQRSLQISENFVPSLSELALLQTELDLNAATALELAEKASRLDPMNAPVQSNLGWVRLHGGDGRGAISALKKAIELEPKVPDHHLRLGLIFYRLELYHFALSKFEDLLALSPEHPRGTVFAGLSMAKLGQASKALETLSRALPSYPPPSELNQVLTRTMNSLREGLEARGERVPPPEGTGDRLLPDVTPQVTAGGILSPAMTGDEVRTHAGAARELASALELLQAGRRDDARTVLDRAVSSYPAEPAPAYQLALLLLEDDALDRSRSLLDSILDRNPLDMAAMRSLGDIYFRTGRLMEYKDILDRTEPVSDRTLMSPFLSALAARWERVLEQGLLDGSDARMRRGLLLFHQRQFQAADKELRLSGDSPLSAMLRAQILIHSYHAKRREVDFQAARRLLADSGYPHLIELDSLWQAIKSPRLQEVRSAIEKELAKKKRVDLTQDDYRQEIIDAARRGEVDEIDVAESPIRSRRWDQITEKIEQTREARTTFKELQEPVLEEIQLDPGRRFRQPDGLGMKGGEFPKTAQGVMAEKPGPEPASAKEASGQIQVMDLSAMTTQNGVLVNRQTGAMVTPPGGGSLPTTRLASGTLPPSAPDGVGSVQVMDVAALLGRRRPDSESIPALVPPPLPPGLGGIAIGPQAGGPMLQTAPEAGLARRSLASGINLVSRGRLQEARGQFERAIGLDLQLETAHTSLLLANLILEDPRGVLKGDARARDQFGPEQVRDRAAAIAALKMGDARKALKLWSSRTSRNQKDLAFLEESRKIWRRVVQDSPRDADALYNLSLLAYLDGEMEAGVGLLERLPRRTGRAGTLYAALLMQIGLRDGSRSSFDRGVSVLRVEPPGGTNRPVEMAEKFAATRNWNPVAH